MLNDSLLYLEAFFFLRRELDWTFNDACRTLTSSFFFFLNKLEIIIGQSFVCLTETLAGQEIYILINFGQYRSSRTVGV